MTVTAAIAVTGVLVLVLAAAFALYATSRHLWGNDKARARRRAWSAFIIALALLATATWTEAL